MRGKVAGESVENKPLRRKMSPCNSLSRALDANAFGSSSLSPTHTLSLCPSRHSVSLCLAFTISVAPPHTPTPPTLWTAPKEKCEKLSYVYKYVKSGETREMHRNSVFHINLITLGAHWRWFKFRHSA